MKQLLVLSALLALSVLSIVGCGRGTGSTLSVNPQPGAVFVTGEDAPVPSVVGMDLTIDSITLTGGASSQALVASPVTVDFARLVGLRAPLAFKAVPPDTYTGATFVLSSPVIHYVSAVSPPQVTTLNGVFLTPTTIVPQTTAVTVTFPAPLVVGANGLAGMRTEIDLRQSLAVDGTGQITGVIDPKISIQAVQATDTQAQITYLKGAMVSVNVPNNSLVMQGPLGNQFTVAVNGSTTYNSGFTLSALPTSGFVALQGTMQADGSLLASDVEFITADPAFIAGPILAVNPATGPVQSVSLWVDETGGGTSALGLLGTVQTVNVGSVSNFAVCYFDNTWFTPNNMFDNFSMLAGQQVLLGGGFVSTTFTPDLISLRRQGVSGLTVPGSVTVSSGNAGSFQVLNTGLLGYSLAGALGVNTGTGTLFEGDGTPLTLTDLQTASAAVSVPVVTRGLVLKDSVTGGPVLWAHRVREVTP